MTLIAAKIVFRYSLNIYDENNFIIFNKKRDYSAALMWKCISHYSVRLNNVCRESHR